MNYTGYTSHGHIIDGVPHWGGGSRPTTVARCGGPGMCKTCSTEAHQQRTEFQQKSEIPRHISIKSGGYISAMGNRQFSYMTIMCNLCNTHLWHTNEVRLDVLIDIARKHTCNSL